MLGQTVAVGHPVTLSVVASGAEPYTYQWRRNGVNILWRYRFVIVLRQFCLSFLIKGLPLPHGLRSSKNGMFHGAGIFGLSDLRSLSGPIAATKKFRLGSSVGRAED